MKSRERGARNRRFPFRLRAVASRAPQRLLVPCNSGAPAIISAPATCSSFRGRNRASPSSGVRRSAGRAAAALRPLRHPLASRGVATTASSGHTPSSDITAVLDYRLAACRLELGAQRRESWSPRFESARIPCVHEGSRKSSPGTWWGDVRLRAAVPESGHHAHERLLGALARLQEAREVAACLSSGICSTEEALSSQSKAVVPDQGVRVPAFTP